MHLIVSLYESRTHREGLDGLWISNVNGKWMTKRDDSPAKPN